MTIRPELLDERLKDYAKPEDLVGEGGLYTTNANELPRRKQRGIRIEFNPL